MNKNLIKLTESDLRNLVKESVNRVLNEIGDTPNGQRALGAVAARSIHRYYDALGDDDPEGAEYWDNVANDAARIGHNNVQPEWEDLPNGDAQYFDDGMEYWENNLKKYESKSMNKKLIKLTESDLHRIVKESVGKILNEIGDTYNGYKMLGRLQNKKAYINNDDNAAEEVHNYRQNVLKNNPEFAKKDQEMQDYGSMQSKQNEKNRLNRPEVQSVIKKLKEITSLMLNHCYLHPKGGTISYSDLQEAIELSKKLYEYSLCNMTANNIRLFYEQMGSKGVISSSNLVTIYDLLNKLSS